MAEAIVRLLQRKFPEIFKDIMAVIIGTREKVKAVDKYNQKFNEETK